MTRQVEEVGGEGRGSRVEEGVGVGVGSSEGVVLAGGIGRGKRQCDVPQLILGPIGLPRGGEPCR